MTEEKPGTILSIDKHHLDIATANGGILRILKLQCPGGKVMTSESFLKSHFTDIQELGCFE